MSISCTDSPVGKIHSYETFGTVDGPGLRFVVFMQGCTFRCLYCHNPDTFDIRNAPIMATPRQVLDRMITFISFYKKGGVTISGGEPLLQPLFVKVFFQLCKAEGIHTAIDTSGHFLHRDAKAVLEYTDLVLLDVKCMDPEIHQALTGHSLKPTLDFAEYLDQKGIPVWIRHVLVPGITDYDHLIEKHADYIAGLKNVEQVELLPYHNRGQEKYKNLGMEYPLKNTEPPTAERIENAKKIFRSRGLRIV